jgi:hypothetical protein
MKLLKNRRKNMKSSKKMTLVLCVLVAPFILGGGSCQPPTCHGTTCSYGLEYVEYNSKFDFDLAKAACEHRSQSGGVSDHVDNAVSPASSGSAVDVVSKYVIVEPGVSVPVARIVHSSSGQGINAQIAAWKSRPQATLYICTDSGPKISN